MPWRAYVAALLVIGLLDAVWLGWIARDFYAREMGDLMAPSVNWAPAALFYVAYPAGLVALALLPATDSLPAAMARGALVGLLAYGTYDLTNLATLRHWSLPLALCDMAWGTFISATAAGAGHWAAART